MQKLYTAVPHARTYTLRLLVTFARLFVASKLQPFVIEMNSSCLSTAGEICPSPLSADAQQAVFESLPNPSSSTSSTAPPLATIHSLQRVLIFDNKPSSNLSCGPTSSTLRVCVLGLECGDGGSAGPGGGRRRGGYEAHSERRFMQSAGALFASESLLLFVVGLSRRNVVCCRMSVSHSLGK